MRTAGRHRRLAAVLLCAVIVAGCAAPAPWAQRPIAAPTDAEAADAERCEADARATARPWRVSPWFAGWLAVDLVLLAAEILSGTPTKEVAIALGATSLVVLLVEAERWDEPTGRQPYAEVYRACMEQRGYRLESEPEMAEGPAKVLPLSGGLGPTLLPPNATGSPR